MALSDAAIRAAKPTRKQFKLYDEGGLFLIVKPSGGKLWRLKYRHLGKEQALSLGRYPDVGLKEARAERDQARKLIASGKNPAFEKKRAAVAASVSAANTFSASPRNSSPSVKGKASKKSLPARRGGSCPC